MTSLAPYMEWAKLRPAVQWDLAGSNLLSCTVDDLPGCRDVIELNGLNPDGYPPLIDAIAHRYGVRSDNVATATGAGGANFLAVAALAGNGDDVLVERPAYDPIVGALRLMGANVIRFDRRFDDGWAVDLDRLVSAVTARTRLIVLTSPHNPSGALVSGEALEVIGGAADRVGALVMVDEVYLDGVYTDRPRPAATMGDVFLSINSLTKSYGLSGLRAGWILASPVIASRIRRVRDVMEGTGSIPSDLLACHAFRHLDALEARARSILVPNLERLARFMDERDDLAWVRPAGGNVAFPQLTTERDTDELAEILVRDHDTAIVPGRFFDMPRHFRIAFSGSAETLDGGLERIAKVLDS